MSSDGSVLTVEVGEAEFKTPAFLTTGFGFSGAKLALAKLFRYDLVSSRQESPRQQWRLQLPEGGDFGAQCRESQ